MEFSNQLSMQNDFPLVSVICPVYNVGKFLNEALDSVFNQTYTNFEVIAVDDCSTDNSFQILESYALKFSNLHLYRNNKNMGNSFSLNVALEHCAGKYVMRMDGDDIIHNSKIKLQVDFLESHKDINVIGCSYNKISRYGSHIFTRIVPETHENIINLINFRKFIISGPSFEITDGTLMASIDWFKKWKYNPNIYFAQDFDLICRSLSSTRFANMKEVLYSYRAGSGVTANIQAQTIACRNKWKSIDLIESNEIKWIQKTISKIALIFRPAFYLLIVCYHKIMRNV